MLAALYKAVTRLMLADTCYDSHVVEYILGAGMQKGLCADVVEMPPM